MEIWNFRRIDVFLGNCPMISSKSKNINFNLDSQHSVDVIYKYPSLLHYQPSHFVDNAALSFRIKVLRAFPTPGINALDQRHLEQWTSFVMFCQKHQATASKSACPSCFVYARTLTRQMIKRSTLLRSRRLDLTEERPCIT